MKPTYFKSPSALRRWFEANHATSRELWVGFYKKDSGRPSVTYQEALDEALCVGWIDGVRKSLDEASYTIRFTPRKPKSRWSAVNIARIGELTARGLMKAPGLGTFESRDRKAPAGILHTSARSNRTRARGRSSRRSRLAIGAPPSGTCSAPSRKPHASNGSIS
jgi:hypothetical protein